MSTPGSPVTVHVLRGRTRAVCQVVGGLVLGLGLAAAVGLDPGLLFAGYTAGLGAPLLCLGLLLPEEPQDPAVRPSGHP